ncbi:MAG: hypothetical protein QW057_05980 [Candidatus Bathyarchaeia archaeon]
MGAFVMLLLAPVSFTRADSAPRWLRPGVYVDYEGNVTMRQQGAASSYTGNMSWTVTGISNGTVFITEKVFRSPDFLERRYEIEEGSRMVLRIAGEHVENQTTYFWVETNLANGSLVQVENFTFPVVNQETLLVGGLSRPCWVVNGTFNTTAAEGLVTRWYDVETGLLLKAFLHVALQRDGSLLEGVAVIAAIRTNALGPQVGSLPVLPVEISAASLAAGGLLLSVASARRRRRLKTCRADLSSSVR